MTYKKYSSIEMLVSRLPQVDWNDPYNKEVLESALEEHKKEIVKAAARGYLVGEDTIELEDAMNYGTKYYNSTFTFDI